MIKEETTIVGPESIPPNDPLRLATDAAVGRLNSMVALREFSFVLRDAAALRYDYTFTATDGREWKQTITFSGGRSGPPTHTFAVDSEWFESEFIPHRDLRAACIALVVKYAISDLRYEWRDIGG